MKRTLHLLTLLLALALLLPSCGGTDGADGADKSASTGEKGAATPKDPGKPVVCPVCGLTFGANEATATHEHGGRTYHFLLADHKEAFAADPASYLKAPPPQGSLPSAPPPQ